MTVRQNLDIDKLEEFRSYLTAHPGKGMLHLEAKATYEGQVGRSTVQIGKYTLDTDTIDRPTRQYTIPFGAWREVEQEMGVQGPTDRMEPVEMVLAATAACLINSVTINTARLGINAEDIDITVKSTVNPRVLFGLKEPSDHRACLGTLEYAVDVKGDVSDEDIKTIKDLCAHSPVHGLIAEAIPIKGHVERH